MPCSWSSRTSCPKRRRAARNRKGLAAVQKVLLFFEGTPQIQWCTLSFPLNKAQQGYPQKDRPKRPWLIQKRFLGSLKPVLVITNKNIMCKQHVHTLFVIESTYIPLDVLLQSSGLAPCKLLQVRNKDSCQSPIQLRVHS